MVFLCMSVWALGAQPEGLLGEDVSDIVNDPCFESANLSFLIRDLESGTDYLEYRSSAALPPASTLKVWTTAAALDQLGADFQFRTRVLTEGTLEGDTLTGDLIIKGQGDPSLGSAHIDDESFETVVDEIVSMLKDRGVTYIEGGVVADASYIPLDQLPRSWPYQDMGNYYGSYYGGLNIHDNLYYLRFRQEAQQGVPVAVADVEPGVPGLELECLVKAGPVGSGDQAYIMGAPLQSNRLVIGTIPPGSGTFSIKGSLPDPALFLAYHIHEALLESGIQVTGNYRSNYREGEVMTGNLIGDFLSPPLLDIVTLTNQKSINLFAEGIGRYLEKEANRDSEFLLDYWEERGADMEGCRLTDFAGLAPDNAITARAMVDILTVIDRDSSTGAMLESSLAVGGESGTLQYMWNDSPAKGNIVAKSGLIAGVRSYAGYVYSRSGKKLVFCLLSQNAACSSQVVRWKLEQLLETVYLSSP